MHIISVYKVNARKCNGCYELQIDNGPWKKCSIEIHSNSKINNRLNLKCNLNGMISSYSAVISPNQIDVFNEVNNFDIFSI